MSVNALLQVEAMLLRKQMPDLLLRPGMTLAARVAERSGRHGIIVLAGAPLVAELPDGVKEGDRLSLMIQEARTDKVVMKLVPETPLAPPQPPTVQVPLPGGGHASVIVEEREGGGRDGGEHAAISLVYETAALGKVNLRLELAPGGVVARAELRAGPSYELADENAGALRDALATATGRSAEVHVSARRDPIDLYA